MRRPLFAFVFVSLPLGSLLATLAAQSAGRAASQPGAPATASGIDLAAVDRQANPCVDFHRFACGEWIKGNPIPADRSRWGRFDELQERNNEVLRGILERAASGGDPATKKIGDHYASCMDEAGIERRGVSPLEADFRRIASLRRTAELPRLIADLHMRGTDALFAFGAESDFKDANSIIAIADQGGLGLPDRDYYFNEDARSVDVRRQYVEHIGNMLALAGTPGDEARTAADAVMQFETAMAKGALNVVARRDPAKIYHKMTQPALQKLTPIFDWTEYIRAVGSPRFDAINVTEPEFFTGIGETLASTPLDDVKTYLRWQLLRAGAPVLPSAFVNENFRFYNATLQGTRELRPRWKRCVEYTDQDLGEALGEAFVKEAFPPRAKAAMLEMVHELENALERDILSLEWMTDATKKLALAKLGAITNKIGYPEKWREYGPLEIVRGDALGNSHRSNAFEWRRQMDKIGKPLDKDEWGMTPPTVNAYYHWFQNNINFPAGILQPPFYNANADPAVNYGGAGAVIGHELTHGFDDQGRQFDSQGNMNDWWTPADAKAFEARAACFVEQYGAYTAIDDVKLNGRLTLGENTADNGGLRIALLAYLAGPGRHAATVDGFTPEQRVFMGWAQVWCENRRPEYERLQAMTNPHAPGRYRVNGVVSNMPEFQQAFSCPANAPMVRGDACRVW
jgi:endothelin-converting enzyme/putative endopeptidase